MDHFAGLDVSVKETSICIVDDTGRIVREVKVASEPAALLKVLGNPAYRFKRIGLEAGPLSQWLFSAHSDNRGPVRWKRDRPEIGFETQAPAACSQQIGKLPVMPLRHAHTRDPLGLLCKQTIIAKVAANPADRAAALGIGVAKTSISRAVRAARRDPYELERLRSCWTA